MDHSDFLNQWEASIGDKNHHQDNYTKIDSNYLELIIHSYPPHNSEEPLNMINPIMFDGDGETQYLPVWITKDKKKLSIEEIKERHPQIMLYNEALVRVIAAGVGEKYIKFFVDGEHELWKTE